MTKDQDDCVWCGSALKLEPQSGARSILCPECDDIYEAEGHRSLHPAEERQPHHN